MQPKEAAIMTVTAGTGTLHLHINFLNGLLAGQEI
jgi:hypothetical protein